MSTLKHKTATGILWNAIDKFAVQGIQFLLGIIIARILSPSDFGLIGMLTIFIVLAQLLIDSGFGKALIQKKNRNDVDFSTVFYFNLLFSIILYFILFFTAPLISQFYNIPTLTILTRVLALSIIINSFSVVQTAKFAIGLEFKKMALINFIAVIISGTIGIIAAYSGFGVWSLVIQTLTKAFIVALLFWIFSRWTPLFVFSFASFKELFHFGSKLLGAGVIATFFQNIYTLLIGKFFSASTLGYYTRGVQFSEFSSGTITSILQNVSFPVLSSLQDDKEKLFAVYKKFVRLSAFIIFPLMTLLALLADPFIRILLTDKWLLTIPILQWLCFARIFTPISTLNMNILNVLGRSDLFLKLDILKIPIMVAILVIALPLGIKAVVIGSLIDSFIAFFINTYYPGKFFNFGAVSQLKEISKIMLATLLMAAIVFFFCYFMDSMVLKLFSGAILGVSSYLFISKVLKINEFCLIEEFFFKTLLKFKP